MHQRGTWLLRAMYPTFIKMEKIYKNSKLWVSNKSKGETMSELASGQVDDQTFNCHAPYIPCRDCIWNPIYYSINPRMCCNPTYIKHIKTNTETIRKEMMDVIQP